MLYCAIRVDEYCGWACSTLLGWASMNQQGKYYGTPRLNLYYIHIMLCDLVIPGTERAVWSQSGYKTKQSQAKQVLVAVPDCRAAVDGALP